MYLIIKQTLRGGGVNKIIIAGLQTRSNNIMGGKKEFFKRIHFLLCESCFWCDSYLSSSASIAKCPRCYSKIEWMPISNANLSRLDHSSQGKIYDGYSKICDFKTPSNV